ncbi:histidinol-phosphatase HisJ family protein [Spirochaeta isovalerica]|uniref:Histidinol-phosphatase n=1 Tax=Spirochaeta isovalerica TaxID=150 RepID=A0A841RH34_9SPIO|nr:histidinol-phosphatase HisJ family protein [Spirochaeta isovalerica]MBB6482507.1 histidinol-phosphatase (PHP family) [Spirochaeta isovalerica]
MNYWDMHSHSIHSEDAESSLESMCLSAIEKSLSGIAFTEHVDFNPADKGYDYFRKDDYQKAIDSTRLKYKGKLSILKGMEFSEPHLYPGQFSHLAEGDWDVIIGSIHMMGDHFVGDSIIKTSDDLKDLYSRYFNMVLEMTRWGGFDILGHMDFPKRYFGKEAYPYDLIDLILAELVRNQIALEINTSPLRKGLGECSPDSEILRRYALAGGTMVTLGSDAHIPEDVAADFDKACSICLAIDGLRIGHFEKRRFVKDR